MPEKLISADNHIDLTYCPADLWSAQAPAAWRDAAPRVEDRDDGLHWLVDGQDKGMWNGVGPGFLKYQKGTFHHVDEMKQAGFEWDYRRGAKPRPTTPELRVADLDKDGVAAEIVYGCLMINHMIANPEMRGWADRSTTTGSPILPGRPTRTGCSRSPSFPTTIRKPRRPRCGAARNSACVAAISHSSICRCRCGTTIGTRCGRPRRNASSRSRSTRPASRRPARRTRRRWRRNTPPSTVWCVRHCSRLDTMEVLVSLLASGACEKYPEFNFVLGESGVTWLPYIFDRLDTEYHDRARSLNFKLKPSDYFRRQGYVTYQQDKFLEPIVPLIGEDNIMWGSDYPHPDSLWPESHAVLAENLAAVSPSVRRKIVCDNVARLYNLN